MENNNTIDFLRLAQETNIYTIEEMREKFVSAEKMILKNMDSSEVNHFYPEKTYSQDNPVPTVTIDD